MNKLGQFIFALVSNFVTVFNGNFYALYLKAVHYILWYHFHCVPDIFPFIINDIFFDQELT